MKHLLLLFFLCLYSFSCVLPQNILIKGKAFYAKEKTIKLITYSDKLSNNFIIISSVRSDTAGNFVLDGNINSTIQAFLQIENFKAELFLEPGHNYNLNIFPSVDEAATDINDPYHKLTYLKLDFLDPPKNELNGIISIFNKQTANFIYLNFQSILRSRSRNKIDSFKTSVYNMYSVIDNPFLQSYIKYKIGWIEFLTRVKNNTDMLKDYFYKQPVLFENPEYMELFNIFYSNYLKSSNFSNFKELDRIINTSGVNYNDLIYYLRLDTLLRDDELTELVLIKQLSEIYNVKPFKKDNILKFLKEVSVNVKSSKNKSISVNLYKSLTKLATYSKAPDINLKGFNGDSFSINNFKNKYIYICFFKSDNYQSLMELSLMSKLYDTYSDKVEFVCISSDMNINSTAKLISENPNFKFHILHFNFNWDLLDNYNINSYPVFVLIDKEGDIVSYPAQAPSGQIISVFEIELKEDK